MLDEKVKGEAAHKQTTDKIAEETQDAKRKLEEHKANLAEK